MLEFFGIIVLHFVNCLLWASVVSLTCCTSQVCCSQSPCPCNRSLLTCASTGRHSNTQREVWHSLLWGPWVIMHTKFCLSPLSIWQVWSLTLNTISPSPHNLVQASPLPLDVGYLFLVGSNILLLIILQLLFAILEFSQEKISTYSSTLPSCENQEHWVQQSWLKTFWSRSLLPPLPLPQWGNMAQQKINQQSTEYSIKNLPPIRERPRFPHSQSLPSGSFHKPLILIYQRADGMDTTITEH